jgi:hypothetical protein
VDEILGSNNDDNIEGKTNLGSSTNGSNICMEFNEDIPPLFNLVPDNIMP